MGCDYHGLNYVFFGLLLKKKMNYGPGHLADFGGAFFSIFA